MDAIFNRMSQTYAKSEKWKPTHNDVFMHIDTLYIVVCVCNSSESHRNLALCFSTVCLFDAVLKATRKVNNEYVIKNIQGTPGK